MGEGSRRVITLSHRAQVRRFTTDVIRVLKYSPTKQVTLEEFPVIYQRIMNKEWNVVDYGVCTIEDLLGEISETVISVTWDNDVTISLPKREQSPEEMERTKCFASEVSFS
ncbi:hypothetical protein PR048_003253 [Dryococelus australis]|uniref:HTH OST-type domain-containing protein n=1 Tax=Dryococelus australis TaxID=614101 RepID=A0ABQ9IMK3_9NEOP|nr:hypothetical protein PR048_003253 [Dryococelus australis]